MSDFVTTRQRPARTTPFHMRHHAESLPECGPLDAELVQIGIYGIPGAQHNPCVFLHNDVLKVAVRVLVGRETINYIARVDSDWTLLDVKPMAGKKSPVVRGPVRTPFALGMPRAEDLRMFTWLDRLWAIGCVHDGKLAPEWIRQAILELSPDGLEIEQVHVMQSDRCEKNWMPCVNGNALSLVYSTDPLIVLDAKAGQFPSASNLPQVLGHVRGGTPLIPFGDGWLAIVHQVYKPPRVVENYNPLLGGWAPPKLDPISGDAPTVYLHQFARFDKELTTVELSEPFFWRTPGIEFAAGLVRHDDRFIASFGVADKEAWCATFDSKAVNGLFEYGARD